MFIKKKIEKYWSQPSLQQGGNSSHGNWQSQTKSEIYGKSLALQTVWYYSVHRNTAMHYQIKIFQMVQINMWIVSTALYHKEYQWYGVLGGVAKVWYAMVWCSRVLWCMEWQGCGLQPFLLIAVSTGSGFFRTQQDTTWAQSSRHNNYSSQLNVNIFNIWLCQLHLINCKENPVIRYDSCGAEYVKRASFWWPSSLKTS